MGNTVLVTANTISAPPAENIALATDATKLPATIVIKVESTIGCNAALARTLENEVGRRRNTGRAEQHGHDDDLVLSRDQRGYA